MMDPATRCALESAGAMLCDCEYHAFLRSTPQIVGTPYRELERRYRLRQTTQRNEAVALQSVDYMVTASNREVNTIPGEENVVRFLKILDLIYSCPWSSSYFDCNRRMVLRLASSWLRLLVGDENAEKHGMELRGLLSVDVELRSSHVAWICNRQQGKTTRCGPEAGQDSAPSSHTLSVASLVL